MAVWETAKADAGSFGGATLARNTAFNFAGQILPLVAGVVLIPYIVRALGPNRFGMLGIIWVIFGYFGLMDLGLGRATTKFLAEFLAKGETDRISEIVWNSVAIQFLIGIVGGLVIASVTPLLVDRLLKIPPSLVGEARMAFYLLAAALPAVLTMSGLRAVLEGCQRFDISNLLRIPSSTLAFVIPAVAIAAGLHLPGIVLWMAVFRVGFAFAHGYCCIRVLPCLRHGPSLRFRSVAPLLSFGGWVTASNLVNPVLVSMDRFLIGSLLSVAMVGYYTAPMEAVTKLWLIPASLMTTVYPKCSALGTARMEEVQLLYSRSMKYIFCVVGPVSLMLMVFAKPIIGIWLGTAFIAKSSAPLQFLAAGVFINCFAHIPFCFLQALGRPDTTAKLFVCELLPYGLLAYWMIERNGIVGAAAAWSIRALVEVLLLIWIAKRVFSLSPLHAINRQMSTAVVTLIAVGLAIYTTDLLLHGIFAVDIAICIFWILVLAAITWKWVLDSADRAAALALLRFARTAITRPVVNTEAD